MVKKSITVLLFEDLVFGKKSLKSSLLKLGLGILFLLLIIGILFIGWIVFLIALAVGAVLFLLYSLKDFWNMFVHGLRRK